MTIPQSILPRPDKWQPWAPRTVRVAVILMVVGAVATIADIIGQYSHLSGNRDALRPITSDAFSSADTLVDSRFAALASLYIVGGLIQAGLWLWSAFLCGRGRNWGRIVSSAFFGFGVLAFGIQCGAVLATTVLTTSAGVETLDALPLLIGFAVVVLLWSEQSGPHFRSAPVGA